ncbi:MAG: hypothetical protein WA705_20855 [Candidatus Ozemobacteraceae bacterium]
MAKAKIKAIQPERRSRIKDAKIFGSRHEVNGKPYNLYHHANRGKFLLAPVGGCSESEIIELPLSSDAVAKIVTAHKGRNFVGSKESVALKKALDTVKSWNMSEPTPKPAAAIKPAKAISKPAVKPSAAPVSAKTPVAKSAPELAAAVIPAKSPAKKPVKAPVTKPSKTIPSMAVKPIEVVIPAIKQDEMVAKPFIGGTMTAIPDAAKPITPETKRPDALYIAITITRAVLEALEEINWERD